MKPKTTFIKKSQSRRRDVRGGKLFMLSIGSALALSGIGTAGTSTWTGGDGSDPNWSVAGNWTSAAAPLTGDDLVFTGSAHLLGTNDLNTASGGTFLVNSIAFDASAGESFEISGNKILFNGKTVTNNSPFNQSLNLRLQETGTGIKVAGTGDLYLQGLESTSFGRLFTKDGTGRTKVDGTYNSADGVSTTSFSLQVNAGTLDWAGQIYGTVNINDGTLLSYGVWHFNTTCKLLLPTSKIGFSATTTELGELDAVGGGVITSLSGGGVTTIYLNQPRPSVIAGNLQDSPDGGRLALLLGMTGTPAVTLSGTNTSTGNIEVGRNGPGATLNLTNTGSLKFRIEPSGVSNKISGLGAVSLNGAFTIDLSGAETPAPGTKWTLVQAANVTYGATFSVTGFTEISPGVWKFNDGSNDWFYTKVSGKLGFGVLPESVWDGDSGGNWSAGGNWTSGAAPVTGDVPVFTGSNTTNNNDLGTAWDTVNALPGSVQLGGVSFNSAAASFNLAGNELYFDGGTIDNLSANPQTISAGVAAGANGLTVATSAGNVILTGSLNNYNSANRALNKAGTGTLVLNGVQSQSWALNVNGGTMQVFNPNTAGLSVGSGGTIATGATLRTETSDAITANGILTLSGGTLNLAGGGEALGAVAGSGVVTNHGSGGTAVLSFQRNNTTWDGSIQNGGSTTAVTFTGTTTGIDSVSFGGANTYTGNTTLGANASFTLSNTGSLTFAPGANGVSNKITGDQSAGTGFVKLDGTMKLDLSGASLNNGNSWSLVDTGTLTETFGGTFKVSDSSVVAPFGYKLNGGNNTVGSFVASTGFATATTGTITHFARTNTIDMSAVTDPAPQGVYQTEFYLNTATVGASLKYTFPGLHAGGNYKIRLHFAELFATAVGARKFDVAINGTLVLDDYDLIAVTGARYKAVVNEFTVPADANGAIIIDFMKVVDNPKVNGIEIIDISSASTDFAKSGATWTRVNGTKTWTFSQTTGVLSLAVSGSAGYGSWITGFGLAAGDQGASSDPDRDGFSNQLEYVLGGNPNSSNTLIAPLGAKSGTNSTLTFTRSDLSEADVTTSVEYGNNLTGWTTVVAPAASGSVGGVAFTVTPNTPSAGLDTVVATIPNGAAAKFFARVKTVR